MAEFAIDRQLLLDTHRIGRLPLCHLLLHKNAVLPWFILVPETSVTDLLELTDDLRSAKLSEASRVSRFVKQYLDYPKINFAAIGNVVPQLHLHVVGRKPGDSCWPAPVWGNLRETREYATVEVCRLKEKLQIYLGSDFIPSQE
jgi:diadenosine tetraphosphate (Ap4A) HIT family hydrolase